MKTNRTRVLLVVNPVSGNRDKEPIIQKVRSFLSEIYDLRIFKTTGKNDRLKLQELLENFPADHILTAGGDGTIKLVAELCRGGEHIIGILPAGSANGLATELELPAEIDRALEIAMGTNALFIDALRIGDSLCLHLADMGLNAELIKNYEDNALRGKFGYLISSIPTLLQTEIPYHFTLEVNGKKVQREAIMVAFTNCRKFGTGAVINPGGIINDGKFEVLVFKKLKMMEILRTLNEKSTPDPGFVEVFSTHMAKITSERPVQLQIDGEPMQITKEVLVSIIPEALRIAVEKNQS